MKLSKHTIGYAEVVVNVIWQINRKNKISDLGKVACVRKCCVELYIYRIISQTLVSVDKVIVNPG